MYSIVYKNDLLCLEMKSFVDQVIVTSKGNEKYKINVVAFYFAVRGECARLTVQSVHTSFQLPHELGDKSLSRIVRFPKRYKSSNCRSSLNFSENLYLGKFDKKLLGKPDKTFLKIQNLDS